MFWNRINTIFAVKPSIANPRLSIGCLILIAFALAGCTMVGPDYVKPTVPEAENWLESDDEKISSTEADISQWWTVFNDPVLNRLIESAYQQNYTLQNAGIRILEARAQLGIAIGSQYPQNQRASGDAAAQRTSKNVPNARGAERFAYVYDMGFDAAWELDIWGKFRRAVQSEMANLEASIANYDDILVTLMSEVARTYILLRTSEERLAVARENVKIQKRSLQIAEVRFKAGAVTELDVTQARSLLGSTEATIPQFIIDIRQAKNALALLLGKLPGEIDTMLEGPGLIPKVPASVAVGIPTELLRRRPDIRSAERQLAAQSALIGFAKADLYPHFALFGSVGFTTASSTGNRSTNAGLSEMFDSSSFNYSVGPGISWDLFNYGRITNRVRVADARFQELAANYENTVLEAAQEAEDSMVAFLRSQDTVGFLADAVKASRRSVDLSMIQYREGLVDYQRVLDTQRFLSEQQDTLVARAGDVDLSLVALYKSLGGGWEIRKGKDFVPENIKEQMQKRTNWGNLLKPQELETTPGEESNKLFNRPDW